MTYTWSDVLAGLVHREGPETETTRQALNGILSDRTSEVQLAALLVTLQVKGEMEDKTEGLSSAMFGNALQAALDRETMDMVGVGDNRANTINISTMAALVAFAVEAKVVRHGSWAASSQAGTADTLEELSTRVVLEPEWQVEVLGKASITFLFARFYHPAMRHVAEARKQLAIRITLNFLDPLSNPTNPQAMAPGVANDDTVLVAAQVLARRGVWGLIFRGSDGLDELAATSFSDVWLLADGRVHRTTLDPADPGLPSAAPSDLRGGDVQHNVQVIRNLAAGRIGPARDIMALSAAAALLAYRGVNSVVSLTEQLVVTLADANRTLDDGSAQRKPDAQTEVTRA